MVNIVAHRFNRIGSTCTDNDVQLAGSDNPSVGRLEVCIHGLWGSVCDDSWTNVNARVVCQQLGYESEGIYFQFNQYRH